MQELRRYCLRCGRWHRRRCDILRRCGSQLGQALAPPEAPPPRRFTRCPADIVLRMSIECVVDRRNMNGLCGMMTVKKRSVLNPLHTWVIPTAGGHQQGYEQSILQPARQLTESMKQGGVVSPRETDLGQDGQVGGAVAVHVKHGREQPSLLR